MRLGILGGTFDPPHVGHLVLASRCAAELRLDQVLFIPAYRPPHKAERALSAFPLRLEMVRAAVFEDGRFVASDLEAERGGVSYTVDTLAQLTREHPGDSLWLLLGRDSLDDLPHWRNPERIAEMGRLAVYARPGYGAPVDGPVAARVDWVSGPGVDVSSSQLREDVRRGRSIRYLVVPAVAEIIERERLYIES